ncbi:MAG: YbaK/EbsC family protein, partial [Salinarchaeum sp.]
MHPTVADFVECVHDQHGVTVNPETFPDGTKTAADAADAIGCSIDQIVKSIAMLVDNTPVVVLTQFEAEAPPSRSAGLPAPAEAQASGVGRKPTHHDTNHGLSLVL